MSLAYATREHLFPTLCLVLLLVASFSLCAVTRQISSHDQTSVPLLGKRPIPPDSSHPDATKRFQNNKRVVPSCPDLLHNRIQRRVMSLYDELGTWDQKLDGPFCKEDKFSFLFNGQITKSRSFVTVAE